MIISKHGVHEIIELVKENAELKRGIGDLFMLIYKKTDPELHVALKNSNQQLSFVLNQVYNLIIENKILSNENKDLKKELKIK